MYNIRRISENFFQDNWNHSHPLPDMRLLIIHPTKLSNGSMNSLLNEGTTFVICSFVFFYIFKCKLFSNDQLIGTNSVW